MTVAAGMEFSIGRRPWGIAGIPGLWSGRIESGEVRGPGIYSTGLGLLPANPGIPPDAGYMGWMKASAPEIADAAQAVSACKTLLDTGVDGIKLFVSAPSKASLSQD